MSGCFLCLLQTTKFCKEEQKGYVNKKGKKKKEEKPR